MTEWIGSIKINIISSRRLLSILESHKRCVHEKCYWIVARQDFNHHSQCPHYKRIYGGGSLRLLISRPPTMKELEKRFNFGRDNVKAKD